MVDLTTTYLGLKLKNPLVASASPLSKNVDAVKRLEDCKRVCRGDVLSLRGTDHS